MLLTNGVTQYSVMQKVAEATNYRVYLCKKGNDNQLLLLQIATEITNNGELDRGAFVLRELKQISDYCEEEHGKAFPGEKINYDRLFPNLVDSFISDEQGRRRVNILTLKDVESIQKMVPLSILRERDNLRISLETSGWILGRLLKLLSFIHPLGITFPQLDGSNILIGPENHHLVLFDWTCVFTHIGKVPFENRHQDIANVCKAVFLAIGGDINTGTYQYDPKHEYPKFAWNLICHNDGDARNAHTQYYQLVHRLFGRNYIPSKTMPL